MSELKAYDMGEYQRVVGNDGGRVIGTWRVLSTKTPGEDRCLVWPLDVTIWMGADGHERRWGQGVSNEDFSARVEDGRVSIDPERVSQPGKRAAVEAHIEELKATILCVVQAARFQDGDPS